MTKLNVYGAAPQSGGSGARKGSVDNPYTQAEYEDMLDKGTWPGGYVEGLGYCSKEATITASSFSDSDSMGSDDSWPSEDIPDNPWGPNDNKGDENEDSYGGNSGKPSGGNSGGGNSGGGSTSGGERNPYPQTTKTGSGTAWIYALVDGVGIRGSFAYQYSARISGYTMSIGVNVNSGNFTGRNFWATAVLKGGGTGEKMYKLSYSNQGYITGTGWTAIGDVSFELPKSGDVTVDLWIGYGYDTGIGNTNASTKVPIYPF